MSLTVIGLNHRTASSALREKLAFRPDELHDALQDILDDEDISEAVILSTCNRTEVYVSALTAQRGVSAVSAFLKRSRRLDETMAVDFNHSRYSYQDAAAIKHLFEVVCSLDRS